MQEDAQTAETNKSSRPSLRWRRIQFGVAAIFLGWLGLDRFLMGDYLGGSFILGGYVLANLAFRSSFDAVTLAQTAFVLFGIVRGITYFFSSNPRFHPVSDA